MTHTSKEQQEVLMKLADDYAKACFDQALHLRITDDKPEAARKKLEKELHRLHAHVQELEAQLEAVGAGGVQALRKTVAASACSGCGSCQKQCQSKEEQAQAATDFDSTHSMSQNAQQGVLLTNEQIEAIEKQVWDLNHFDEVEREGNRKFAHLIAAATHPTPQVLDAKDAARYRWLRNPCSGAERVIFYSRGDYGRGLMSSSALDAAIDAAMQRTTARECEQ